MTAFAGIQIWTPFFNGVTEERTLFQKTLIRCGEAMR
jgi:hypothetical protein